MTGLLQKYINSFDKKFDCLYSIERIGEQWELCIKITQPICENLSKTVIPPLKGFFTPSISQTIESTNIKYCHLVFDRLLIKKIKSYTTFTSEHKNFVKYERYNVEFTQESLIEE